MATESDVAVWMLAWFEREGCLYQDEAADGISKQFGNGFTVETDAGGMAINKGGLREFRRMTRHAVWDKSERAWRRRVATDLPTRQTD